VALITTKVQRKELGKSITPVLRRVKQEDRKFTSSQLHTKALSQNKTKWFLGVAVE
jgi:hypothetical protein